MRAALLALVGLAACQRAIDNDGDGFFADEDCDDGDPTVHPGAFDAPGDGVDADCDGVDPDHAFVGAWRITDLNALYSTFAVIVPGSVEGRLEVAPDGEATLTARADLDAALVGVPLAVDMDYAGYASTAPGEGGVALYVSGLLDAAVYEEESYAELYCSAVGDVMRCEGTLKAIETTLDTWAELARD